MFGSNVSTLNVSEPSRSVSVLRQRTLKTAISCRGVGLHSGGKITMTLRPGEADSGILFRRTDIKGKGATIAAHWASVSDTRMNTCISNEQGVNVRTIEHLMSALAGMGIDNAVIDINGEEVPVMDGSAAPFLFLIECAGIVEQDAPRRAIRVLKPVTVTDGNKSASLVPSDGFSLDFEIDFATPAIARQECFVTMRNGAFKSEISRARTFGFEQEVAMLRSAGLARGGSLDNAVVIGADNKVLNEDGLRYEDEFVRHKILDAVGDLYLAGGPLMAHFHGVRSGHALNNQLLRALFADSSAWTYSSMDSRAIAPLPSVRTVALAAAVNA